MEGVFQVIICQLLDFSLARSSLPYGQGGGSLRAFRRGISREQGGEVSTFNLEKCSLLVFAALLSKLQFTLFRGATFYIAIYSYSWRYFRNYILLVLAAPISKLQCTRFRCANFEIQFCLFSGRQLNCFRGANFEIAVYSCSPPKPFPIDRNHPKMLPQNP